MSSLLRADVELGSARGASPALRYLPHVLIATVAVSVLPIAIVWALRERGAITSPWIALPLAVALSLLAAVAGSAWWSRRRRADDLMFSELLLWGWLRRIYIDRQIERSVGRLRLADPVDRSGGAGMTVERRAQLLSQLAGALEAQDPYLNGHSRRVARHARMIARKLGLGAEDVARIRRAAVLHDVGKLRVPQALLNKPGRLSATEFEQVKQHADEGAKMVAGLGDDQLTAIVRHHHERLDGTGYPDGLRGAQIPLGARVIAVADTYDAIIAARPYRPAAPHKAAFDTLRAESLTHLDPALVRAFRNCYSGRGPLVFWESLAAWIGAVHFLPHRAPSIARRVPLSEVMATTVAATIIAVAAVAAPIGVQGAARRPAAPSVASAVVLTPPHGSQLTPLAAPTRRAPANAPRSAHVVVRRPTPSTTVPQATHHFTPSPRLRRGTPPASVQTPVTPGRTSLGTHPPTGAAQPPRPKPRPNPGSPRPPTRTTTTKPPATAPPPPSTGVSPTTPAPIPSPSSTPTGTPSPPPVNGTTGHPTSKDQCKNGGYVQYGFSNQGQCIAAVEHRG